MPFSTIILQDSPIIVQRLEPGPHAAAEIPAAIQQAIELLEICNQSVYLIVNLEDVSMGLDDIVQAASKSTRGSGAILHHPKIIESLFVVTNGLLKMGLMGLSSEVFGKARVRTFDTLDHALESEFRVAPADADAVAQRLRQLLSTAVH